ncbi:MAG: hypothetical protein O4861_13915 [Trichodesmium sp. St16_bin4-tuft]|nr:hypothetical protein [Trichodesmium sp. MAG_R01]MDE5068960.1 hypothetical protein [Trichodesmium sp. St4_bin8_1]MDE5071831.1 hypothetical protein [Trichodesmium sp. St5_bin8]MDE5099360.1 hypothetical protein [Trichodesmium sp. St16_bin4-tuft]MDE5104947.1 hypothetical protein [Trichodesmium sp. St19_bin2]
MKSNTISFIKIKMYSLIEKMSDLELEKAWESLQILYYDSFIMTAIQKSKTSHKPGDIFTKEEALQILFFEKED